VDEQARKVFCLAEAPIAEAAPAVHRERLVAKWPSGSTRSARAAEARRSGEDPSHQARPATSQQDELGSP